MGFWGVRVDAVVDFGNTFLVIPKSCGQELTFKSKYSELHVFRVSEKSYGFAEAEKRRRSLMEKFLCRLGPSSESCRLHYGKDTNTSPALIRACSHFLGFVS